MEISIPVNQDLSLTITDKPDERSVYPTSRLQKGLLMRYRGLDLAEEAVGFGVPMLKQGLRTFFAGDVELDLFRGDSAWVLTAVYTINLVEKIARRDRASLNNKLLDTARDSLAVFFRQFALVREFVTALSSWLRRIGGWEKTYQKAGFSAPIKMTYTFDDQTGMLAIEADLAHLPQGGVTEVIIMNEQGAHYFEQYRDSSGTDLSGKEIGCWDEVTGEEAGFACSARRVAFSLHRVPGARLFRGRELIGSQLAWSGFGYSIPPTIRRFKYTLRIEELP